MKTNRNELLNTILDSFSVAIKKADTEKSAAHSGRVTTRFYPTEASANTVSGIVGRCRRRTYYSQQGIIISQENDIQTLGRFKVGNILESWIRELAVSSGIRFDHSVKLRYSIPGNEQVLISGEVDMIYKIGDEIVGGEIKTSYGYDFESTVFHKQTIPGMPKVEHVMQVLLYLYYYKHIDTSLGITRFVITYLNRGSMEFISHVIELSDDLYPIVNGILLKGVSDYTNPIFQLPSINTEKTRTKLLDYEFCLSSVFNRYLEIYNHHEAGLLIAPDYNPLYTEEQITDAAISGKIGKTKFSDYKSGRLDFICDKECNYCQYRTKCLTDSGII
jgi:hypothetical protein